MAKKSAKLESCIQQVKKKGGGNPHAICQAAVGKKRAVKKK